MLGRLEVCGTFIVFKEIKRRYLFRLDGCVEVNVNVYVSLKFQARQVSRCVSVW